LRCAPRWQSLAFLHLRSPNTAVAGMAEVVAAVSMAVVEVGGSTVVEAGVTLISVVADVLRAVKAERHRVHFQGRALVGIAPSARGRTA
jgi:hypothetical protein